MKRIIATLLIFLLIINIYIPSSNATSIQAYNDYSEGVGGLTVLNEGSLEMTKEALDASGQNNGSAIVTALLEILAIVPQIGHWIISKIVLNNEVNYISEDGSEHSFFTIQDMLFGKFYLFDIDFFNIKNTGDPNTDVVNKLKENVSIWYVSVRNIAIVLSALILIYIAIRLAISLSASNKPAEVAKYRKMITSWLIGIILIFLVHYLVRILFYINDVIINFIYNIIPKGTTGENIEKIILVDSWNHIAGARGINKLAYVVLYWAIVYYEVKFFIMYLKRLLSTFFLMIIGPLVCMIYPIDFVGDGRSQSFITWFKILLSNILMQAIHLTIFIVFIFTANEIATEAPLVAIAFFATLSNGEKIIKQIFGLNGESLKDIKFKRLKIR